MAVSCFASETYCGAHPAVLEAVLEASRGGALAPYGEDPLSEEAQRRIAELFGPGVTTLLTFNGTGANVVGLGAMLAAHEAVICPESAHIHQDECGAFERILGRKLLVTPEHDGKLTPALLERELRRVGQTRAVQPRVVSVSQCTELGTCYGIEELRELTHFAHAHGLRVHLDGARLANAAEFLGVELCGASRDCGVDVLSLGFTKNGGLCADAVLVFVPEVAQELRFLHKQMMQVASKARFLAAQVLALLDGELWRANAAHANAMAVRLAKRLDGVAGVEITRPVEANSVFVRLDPAACARLQEQFRFYVWDEASTEARWTCAWDTEVAAVDALAAAVRAEHSAP